MSEAGLQRFGEGVLARVAALVYTLLVIEVLFLVATLPGLGPLVLLDRDASNIPLAALCALPLGPALSAAVYALQHRSADLTDLTPAAAFWRGYKLNVGGVLKLWAPFLAGLTVIAVNVAYSSTADIPGWWVFLLGVVAAIAALWAANAVVITSLFAFRARDVARLAAYFLARTKGVALGNLCLAVVAFGVIYVASEAVLALLGSVFALSLVKTCRPMADVIREEFVA